MRITTHPGEMIVKEFLEPKGMSAETFINDLYERNFWHGIRIDHAHWHRILKCKDDLTDSDMANLADYTGMTTTFWRNTQRNYTRTKRARNLRRWGIAPWVFSVACWISLAFKTRHDIGPFTLCCFAAMACLMMLIVVLKREL